MIKHFWKCAITRAIKTVCQTAIATIGTASILADVNWLGVLSASVLAGILSILTSIVTGLPEVEQLLSVNADDELIDSYDEEREGYDG